MAPTMNDSLETMRTRHSWHVRSSDFAQNTFNPIRSIIEGMKLEPHPEKSVIALSIGDPTLFGNLRPPAEALAAIQDGLLEGNRHCGYTLSTGHVDARKAVAEFCSVPGAEVKDKDVILCSGCSHSLDLCISVLGNRGQNLLVPKPGFPIYKTLAEGLGISCKYYNLLPDRNWEIDLDHLESLIDANTCAVVINNPSNPCGSVFSQEHLQKIVEVAARNYVVIIADEIYDYFVFPGNTFHPIASLSSEVPILTCGGLTKRFMVPGWRMGWVLVHDRNDILMQVRKGLLSLSQRIIGSNTIVQAALPAILRNTPQEFFDNSIRIVKENADLSFGLLSQVPGLTPIMPRGAMYMMIAIDMAMFPEFRDEMQLAERLFSEESVSCLPGRCFDYPNYVRIVLTVPLEQMKIACQRVTDFCKRHHYLTLMKKTTEGELIPGKTTAILNGNTQALKHQECSDKS